MSDPLAPPPSYEVSQQEFDRKVNLALEASSSSYHSEEEEWEEWDDTVFEAHAAAVGGSSSSSSNQTFSKAASLKRPKEQPSWLAEAGLSAASSSSTARIQASSVQDPISNTASGHHEPAPLHFIPDDDEADEDRSIPPPPWAPAPSSLARPPPDGAVVLSYQGNASNPPSPLTSPIQSPAPLPNPSFAELTVPEPRPPPLQHHQSLFLPRKPPRPRMGPRPLTTSYRSSPASHAPSQPQSHMRFDPSIAYDRQGRSGSPSQMFESPYASQPSHTSFYNSSVAAHLSPSSPVMTDRRPHSSSVLNSRQRNSFVPQHASHSAPTTPQSISYNRSSISQYPSYLGQQY